MRLATDGNERRTSFLGYRGRSPWFRLRTMDLETALYKRDDTLNPR